MGSMDDLTFLIISVIVAICILRTADEDWLKHAVVYQIYPRSFKDSNDDGIGDLQGIISKLDFLSEAGVNAIWLSPVYPSPMVDAGYDISNFTDIHPDFGTLDDFDELVSKANEAGIKIIMDFVPNHTSNQHIWFSYSENKIEGYEDFYIWKNSSEEGVPPNNWISVFKYSAWEYSEVRGEWYLHQFATEQPDLNYRNPAVAQAMKDVLVFWMDRGVSGFRVDAISHLYEEIQFLDEPLADGYDTYNDSNYKSLNHIYSRNQIETYWEVYEWRALLNNYSETNSREQMILMTEAWETTNLTMMFYGNETSEGVTFPFNFKLITDLSTSTSAEDLVNVILDWLNNMPEGKIANWVLGNHDQHRIATRLSTDRVDGYNLVAQLLPGTVLTYNGEEIGMEDGEVSWDQGQDPSACNGSPADFNSTSRDFERTPYQWDNTTNAGFSSGNETWLPVSSKYLSCNLLDQRYPEDKRSHYHVYKSVVALRSNEPFITGNVSLVAVTENIIAFTRQLDGYDTYAVLFNLGENSESGNITENFPEFYEDLEVVIASVDSTRNIGDKISPSYLELDAFESLVVKANTSGSTSSASTIMNAVLILAIIFYKLL